MRTDQKCGWIQFAKKTCRANIAPHFCSNLILVKRYDEGKIKYFKCKKKNKAPIFGSTPESWAMKRAATALTQKMI